MNMEAMIDKYFRPGRLPHIWCPGCGNGVVTGTIVKAVAKLDLDDKDKVAVISGIGCSSRASGYLDFNTVHSAHGRALPVATGVKLADPGLTIVVTRRRRRYSDRRQPPDPRCPPQHRYDCRTLQQQYLRHDRRPVFA